VEIKHNDDADHLMKTQRAPETPDKRKGWSVLRVVIGSAGCYVVDALILANSGLNRLHASHPYTYTYTRIPTSIMLPPGACQGIVSIVAAALYRKDNQWAFEDEWLVSARPRRNHCRFCRAGIFRRLGQVVSMDWASPAGWTHGTQAHPQTQMDVSRALGPA
jgi:hypothetical protein